MQEPLGRLQEPFRSGSQEGEGTAMACGGGGVRVASLEGEPHPWLMDQMWGTGRRSRAPGGAGVREGWWAVLSGVMVGGENYGKG